MRTQAHRLRCTHTNLVVLVNRIGDGGAEINLVADDKAGICAVLHGFGEIHHHR